MNGIIFQSNSISNEDLFDKKVIVDISRIGSTETKSLIMGILIMKLQEYRMSKESQNDALRHVTVLEEAHNILKRTSSEQYTESANLAGKSVEMIANAIAEMRTYGEGFIIADQAPQLMDMSVIRNTNTKIVLRLPDQSDRELVGKAMGLTDAQIDELSRLRRGVAAVSQSDWLEAVLCDVDEFKYNKNQRYNKPTIIENDSLFENRLKEFILGRELYKDSNIVDDEWISFLKERALRSKLSGRVKYMLFKTLDNRESQECLQKLAYEFFDAQAVFKSLKSVSDTELWIQSAIEKIRPNISDYTEEQVKNLLKMLVVEQAERDGRYNDFLVNFSKYVGQNGGVIC
jgi:hypothetical protein